MLGASVEILLERPALGPRGNGNAYWPGHTIPLCSASRYRVSREGVTTRAPEAEFELPNLLPEAAHMPPQSGHRSRTLSMMTRGAVGLPARTRDRDRAAVRRAFPPAAAAQANAPVAEPVAAVVVGG
jgi:hypothetical protein